jgi:hypothetical protein
MKTKLIIVGAKATWKPLKVCYLAIKYAPYDATKIISIGKNN